MMYVIRSLLLTSFITHCCVSKGEAQLPECGAASTKGRSLSLSINSERNETGDWVTFSALKDSANITSNVTVDVKHTVTECEGRQLINIQGVIKGNNIDVYLDRLIFYPKAGTNVAIFNKGRTAQKLNMQDDLNGVVLLNRPLKDNEIFEVKLEKKGSKFSHSMGIGVTIHSPSDHNILPHMNRVKSGTWMYYGANIWNNGTKIIENYGKNIYTLEVGGRVGVMRSESGTLHFFVNGVDQGAAAANLPRNLYGVFELFGNAGQVTFTDMISQ